MSQIIKREKSRFGLNLDLIEMLKARSLAVIAFLAAALVSIIGLDRMLSGDEKPNLGLFSKKVDFLAENHDRYNVLFVGTSMIYRAIDPVVLQRVAADQGCDVRAFNLGISKLRLTELRHIRDQLSADKIGGYDLIVLSPMAASGINVANWPSSRVQHFSDWEGYKTSLIDLWEYPATKRLPRMVYYSALLSGAFMYRQLGIGRLIGSLEGWPGSIANNNTGDVFDGGAILDFSRHGFVALDDEPDEQFVRRQDGMIHAVGHFEYLKTSNPDIAQFQGASAERAWRRYERSMDYFADADVPILMLLPPMAARRNQDRALADYAAAQGMPLLNYNQIDRYPALFENENWFDYYHTSKAGAVAVSELLGNDICSFMTSKGT